jgi:hypothetical protein
VARDDVPHDLEKVHLAPAEVTEGPGLQCELGVVLEPAHAVQQAAANTLEQFLVRVWVLEVIEVHLDVACKPLQRVPNVGCRPVDCRVKVMAEQDELGSHHLEGHWPGEVEAA